MNAPVRHEVKCEVIDHGPGLVLTSPDQTEWVYYRPSRFLPNTIAGDWRVEADGLTETMHLGKDGFYRLVQGHIVGHYRLWPSRYGTMMTAVVHIPGHGGFFMIWKYQLQGDQLAVDAVHPAGPFI